MKKAERIARQKKLARAIQVREAQRRRRARLKSENQKFLQIIVPEELRAMIFDFGNENQLTLQEAAVVLIRRGLGITDGEGEAQMLASLGVQLRRHEAMSALREHAEEHEDAMVDEEELVDTSADVSAESKEYSKQEAKKEDVETKVSPEIRKESPAEPAEETQLSFF